MHTQGNSLANIRNLTGYSARSAPLSTNKRFLTTLVKNAQEHNRALLRKRPHSGDEIRKHSGKEKGSRLKQSYSSSKHQSSLNKEEISQDTIGPLPVREWDLGKADLL